jgi:uncharacterized repeat protein (TIGR03806 family)
MKNNIRIIILNYSIVLLFIIFYSCSTSEDNDYTPIEVSPVVMNLADVPYANLSEYKFFKGEIKNQLPSYGVIPFKPASELFTDYALKSRFVWLPNGTKATYTSDAEVLNLPVGSALIKTFYYNNVQPSNTTKIIETRLMIKTTEANEETDGWIFAEYLWNADQTDATLQTQGSTISISWLDQNSESQTIDYKIPSTNDCKTCHDNYGKSKPIGIKPQNLNNTFNYTTGAKNQLVKWMEFGYLENIELSTIVSTVDFKDSSKSLDLRVRSYFDINCAHCHQDGGNAEYMETIRMAFNQTSNSSNMGVCIPADIQVPGIDHGQIVKPSNPSESTIIYLLTTNQPNLRMPRVGRTIAHQEGIQLVTEWINSLSACP